MYRSYDYHSSSYSYADEYLERINRIQRMPSMIADTPDFPNVHEVLNNKPMYVEEHDNRQKKMSNENQHQQNHQSPEVHKEVHSVEHEKKMSEVGKDGKGEVVEKGKIDAEAEGYIQRKHRGFELCKWDTFKVY